LHFDKFVRAFDLMQFKLNRTNEDLFRSHYTMLNIKQLNHTIDSLSGTRAKRVDFFREKFLKQYSYLLKMDTATNTKRRMLTNDTIKSDSIVTKPLQAIYIKYPLLDNFDHEAQIKIVDHAQNGARNARDNAIFYKNELESRRLTITKHQVVWHTKFKLSLACLIFFFIGAPLGAIIRKGGLGLPVVVSVVFFVLYHIVTIMGVKAAKTGEWDIIFGSWLSTALILPLGLFLTYKATTDAPLLDAESWKKFFERFKILKLIKKKK